MRVDLAADLGEGFGDYRMGDDAALLEIVTSANIACGFHAGDPRIMHATVAECVRRGVGVGAHPGLPDRVGFGRRTMELTPHEVRTDVLYQLGALSAFATAHGTRLRHVTPHGQLGNVAAVRPDWAAAVVEAVTDFDQTLAVVALDGALTAAARSAGLPVAVLGLADRAYQEDGTLVRRSSPGAVLTDHGQVAERVVRMVTDGTVEAITGRVVELRPDTVLLHGDTPGAVDLARTVRAALRSAGVAIEPLASVLAARA
ncbi:LamB/YcsF family protein [Solihabitans fulvus]|uniref:5-oxoprolinase subunit A n=1 Tax=Solihabitans fulvus TaxID=1892852 RepID=A0A5B2XDH1_9PSEU|nr:5-oxoprolinase subunit PxpA [Solihabitans fulvus]KAA2261393.1 LamB/YcsF family protein [Solihabitans fulvus]